MESEGRAELQASGHTSNGTSGAQDAVAPFVVDSAHGGRQNAQNQFGHLLPPRASLPKNRRPRKNQSKSRQTKYDHRPGWDEGCTAQAKIPDYYAFNDASAQGYMGKLRK